MRQASRGRAHPLQPSGIAQQSRNCIRQPHPLQLRLFYYDRRAGALQRLSIDPLMSSAARGKGTKTAGLPAAVISATVLAPDRQSNKSARANAAGISVIKGATSTDNPACLYAACASL